MDNNYNHHFFVLALFLHQQKTFGPGLSCLCAMVRAWWESLCQTPCLSSQFVLSSSHLSYSPKKKKNSQEPPLFDVFLFQLSRKSEVSKVIILRIHQASGLALRWGPKQQKKALGSTCKIHFRQLGGPHLQQLSWLQTSKHYGLWYLEHLRTS